MQISAMKAREFSNGAENRKDNLELTYEKILYMSSQNQFYANIELDLTESEVDKLRNSGYEVSYNSACLWWEVNWD